MNEMTKMQEYRLKEKKALERYLKTHTSQIRFTETKTSSELIRSNDGAATYKLTISENENEEVSISGGRQKKLASTAIKTLKSVLLFYNEKLDKLSKSSDTYDSIIKTMRQKKNLLEDSCLNIDDSNHLTLNQIEFEKSFSDSPNTIKAAMLGDSGLLATFAGIFRTETSTLATGVLIDVSK